MATKVNTKIEGIDAASQNIVDLFLSNYPNSDRTYVNAIRRLVEQINKVAFSEYTYDDYIVVVEEDKSANKGGKKTFFQYLYCYNYIDKSIGEKNYWNKNELIHQFKSISNRTEKKIEYKQALTIDQLEKLCLFVNQVPEDDFENLRLAFSFEMLFFEGINSHELIDFDAKDYENSTIRYQDKIILLNPKYHKMFVHLKTLQQSKFTILNKYIAELGNKIGIKKLYPKDITAARKQNLLVCPCCGRQYLSLNNNWVNVNGYITCANCAIRLAEDFNVKKNYKINQIDSVNIEFVSTEDKIEIECAANSFSTLKRQLPKQIDYLSLHETFIKIGRLGEKYVLEFEKERLQKLNSKYAEYVSDLPSFDNTNGYDILSYTESGTKVYIEVKTTSNKNNVPFYLSQHEYEFANKIWSKGGKYFIYRVINVTATNNKDIRLEIYDSLDQGVVVN